MPSCAVTACGNYNAVTKGMGIKYYKFPKNEDILKQWIVACRRKDKINLKNACICSAHFEQSCFEHTTLQQELLNYTPRNFRNLKPDAVPTLNLSGVRKKPITKQKRNKQSFKRKSSKPESSRSCIEMNSQDEPNSSSDSENENDESLKEMSLNIQLNSENRGDTSSDAENEIDIKPVKNAPSNTKTSSEYEHNINNVPKNEICRSIVNISSRTEMNLKNQPNAMSSHSENKSTELIKNTSSNTIKKSRTKANIHSESQHETGCKMIYHLQRMKCEIKKEH